MRYPRREDQDGDTQSRGGDMAGADAAPPKETPRRRGAWEWVRERLGRSSPQGDAPARRPWRVEGMDGGAAAGAGGGEGQPRRSPWTRFWWLLIVLLAVNWIISSLL